MIYYVDEDLDGSEIGTQVLDSFKSFLSAVSNVEGIDSVGGTADKRGELDTSTNLNVNFDRVYDILNGTPSIWIEV